jgi:3-hydroxyacyl-[acyl-carrier-protein] dehydratase
MSESPSAPKPPDIGEILKILPHRYPFLLIDRVVEWEPGVRTVCIKNVTANEPFFQGHFPENPIMPGVLIIEALAQTGALGVLASPQGKGKLAMLAGVDGAKFRRPVVPGDQLRLETEIGRLRRGYGRSSARALVDGELAAEMTISFALVDPPEPDDKDD